MQIIVRRGCVRCPVRGKTLRPQTWLWPTRPLPRRAGSLVCRWGHTPRGPTRAGCSRGPLRLSEPPRFWRGAESPYLVPWPPACTFLAIGKTGSNGNKQKTTSLVVLGKEYGWRATAMDGIRNPGTLALHFDTNLAFMQVTTVPTVTFSLMWTGPYMLSSHRGGLLFLSTTSNSTSTSACEGGSPLSAARTLRRYLSR